jgi:hypothetical protein
MFWQNNHRIKDKWMAVPGLAECLSEPFNIGRASQQPLTVMGHDRKKVGAGFFVKPFVIAHFFNLFGGFVRMGGLNPPYSF